VRSTYVQLTRTCGAPIQRWAAPTAPTARRALEGNTNTNLQEDGGEHGGEHWHQRGVHCECDDGHVLVAERVQRVLHHCRSHAADMSESVDAGKRPVEAGLTVSHRETP
jgi:hypothetical protein